MNISHSGLSAGAARIDLTPPPGVDLTGFGWRDGPSTGVHDAIYARALALDDGTTRALLIACDLLGLEAGTVAALRAAIEAATGIPAAHIMLACSHTHAGPACMFLRNCGETDRGWLAALPQKLTAVAQEAVASLRAAKLAAGATTVEGVSCNRRHADGPLDTGLQLLRLTDCEGQPLAALVNFACHPITTGSANRLLSADFPGVICREIEARTGATALFLTGASADINPVTSSPELDCRDGSFEVLEHNGRQLAAAALECWDSARPLEMPALRVESVRLQLPLLPAPAVEELKTMAAEYYRAMADSVQSGDDFAYNIASARLQWAMATLKEHRLQAVRHSVEAENQVIAVGETAIAGVPGELFTRLGQIIRQKSPFAPTFISTCTNGNLGYIPAREEYSHGGYEICDAYQYYGYPAALAPAAGEAVVEAALKLLSGAAK
jgi:hypothetical protein